MLEDRPNEEMSDHDLLVAMSVDMAWLKRCFSNHLVHHTKYEVALIVAIILLVVKELFAQA
jgi:hypothetical protein